MTEPLRVEVLSAIAKFQQRISEGLSIETYEAEQNAALWSIAQGLLLIALELNATNEKDAR